MSTALIISGGGGKGIGLTIGALEPLHQIGMKFDSIIVTSQGGISGGFYSINPTLEGIKEAQNIYLDLKKRDLFDSKLAMFWRLAKLYLNPNKYDSIADSKKIRGYLKRVFGDVLLGELPIPMAHTVVNISSREFMTFSSKNHPDMKLRDAAYATSAQVPYIDPLDFEGQSYIDGGLKEVIPFRAALKELPSISEAWVLAVREAPLKENQEINGLLRILDHTGGAVVDFNIRETLDAARDEGDNVTAHVVIIGEGSPESDFFNFFDYLQEFIDVGRKNMEKYLGNPKPLMLKKVKGRNL